jgi:hypothetical protein
MVKTAFPSELIRRFSAVHAGLSMELWRTGCEDLSDARGS